MVYICPGGNCTGMAIFFFDKVSHLKHPNGCPGVGKSITLTHLTHFGHADGWIVLPLLNLKQWLVRYYEVAPSTYTAGAIDHITNANVFLKNFKCANPGRLEGCVTHREYVWSNREKTPAGAPLAEVINSLFFFIFFQKQNLRWWSLALKG